MRRNLGVSGGLVRRYPDVLNCFWLHWAAACTVESNRSPHQTQQLARNSVWTEADLKQRHF